MKNLILLVFIMLFTFSCKTDKKVETKKSEIKTNKELPFLGTWTRSFEMGNGVSAKVTYSVFKDSIQYEMLGPMTMKYTLVKDSFYPKDNRWIGKRGETPYAIFVKNISKDAITLLKMKVNNKEDAEIMPFPSDSARSKFSSWNTYQKK